MSEPVNLATAVEFHNEIARLHGEIASLRLTDAERAAVKDAISCCEDITYGGAADQEAADVLKALLERTK